MDQHAKIKAQSAMEYLMTYGWAILIIAVVLGALFSLGVFSGNNLLGNACIAQSGFLCQNPVYSHGSGGLLVTVGQNTGINWLGANFIFVPQGTHVGAGGVPSISFWGYPANIAYTYVGVGNTIASGQTETVWLGNNAISPGGPSANAILGTSATGTIWAVYEVSGVTNPQPQYVRIASINIKSS